MTAIEDFHANSRSMGSKNATTRRFSMKNSVLQARDAQPRRMLSYGSLKPCTPRGTGNYEAVLAFEEGPISGALTRGSTIPIR
jgi:hypothetical protein